MRAVLEVGEEMDGGVEVVVEDAPAPGEVRGLHGEDMALVMALLVIGPDPQADLCALDGPLEAHVGAGAVLIRAREETEGVGDVLDETVGGHGDEIPVANWLGDAADPEVVAGEVLDGLEVLRGVDVLDGVVVRDGGEAEAAGHRVGQGRGWEREGADGGGEQADPEDHDEQDPDQEEGWRADAEMAQDDEERWG